jgi:hypothetical protein
LSPLDSGDGMVAVIAVLVISQDLYYIASCHTVAALNMYYVLSHLTLSPGRRTPIHFTTRGSSFECNSNFDLVAFYYYIVHPPYCLSTVGCQVHTQRERWEGGLLDNCNDAGRRFE